MQFPEVCVPALLEKVAAVKQSTGLGSGALADNSCNFSERA